MHPTGVFLLSSRTYSAAIGRTELPSLGFTNVYLDVLLNNAHFLGPVGSLFSLMDEVERLVLYALSKEAARWMLRGESPCYTPIVKS